MSKTYEDYSNAIEEGLSLQFVPEEMRDYDLCMKAVKGDKMLNRSHEIVHVPRHVIDEKMAMIAIESDPESLQFIPLPLRTRELCFEAVYFFPQRVMRFVPDSVKDKKLCLEATKNWRKSRNSDEEPNCILDYIPEHLRDEEVWLEIIKIEGCDVFHLIPEEFKTQKVCLTALQQGVLTSSFLRELPPQYKTIGFILYAWTGFEFCKKIKYD